MSDRAAIVVQHGSVSVAKQRAACIAYIIDQGYQLVSIIEARGSTRDAVAMVLAGAVQVVVLAYGGRTLAADVIAAGGRVEAVHPTPHVVEPPVPPPVRKTGGMLARLRRRGKSVEQIAAFMETSTGEIRDMLRRGE